MALAKRIILFLLVNFLVITTVSVVLNVLHIAPYLQVQGLNLQSLLIFCLLWGMIGALISLSLSRITAKWALRVQSIDPATHDPEMRKLLEIVQELVREAKLPAMPEVGVYRSNEVNAFATGPTRRRSLVAVSTGLLQRMDTKEIRGVLGHEISHIANGDMVTMTLLQGVVNAFVMFLARVLAYTLSGLSKQRSSNESSGYMSYVMFTYLFEVIFMLLGSMVIATYSRFREFRADRGGAQLAGRESMISALQTLRTLQKIEDPHAQVAAMNAFKISHPSKRGILSLFATHPPLEERIARLQEWR